MRKCINYNSHSTYNDIICLVSSTISNSKPQDCKNLKLVFDITYSAWDGSQPRYALTWEPKMISARCGPRTKQRYVLA